MLLWLVVLACVPPAAATVRRETIGDGTVAVLAEDGSLHLEALPLPQEGLLKFTERLCGSQEVAEQVADVNDYPRSLLKGVRYRVPLSCLRPSLQVKTFLALFPEDGAEAEGWVHLVGSEGSHLPASLWRISEWFTGSGQNYPEIREFNRLDDENLQPGQRITIPTALLLPALRGAVPSTSAGSRSASARASQPQPQPRLAQAAPSVLSFERDSEGEYAVYQLRPGEALYTSVVVRFTGRLSGSDVNQLAGEIARRSDIADVTDIPIGYEVKVPVDLLLPEFLPEDHPRRVAWEADMSASDRFSNSVQAAGLEGITVILDAGHGGKDVGASKSGVWESLYVYDIMLRVRRQLLERTAAQVHTTTREGGAYTIRDREVLPFTQGHAVLTTPPYVIEQGVVSTNFRWYLSNSLYARARKNDIGSEKVIFLSIHADSLHPSLRGAMVYVPGLLPNPASHGKSEAVYTSRKEVREKPRVTWEQSERTKSLGLSRQLADDLLAAFRTHDLLIHENKPVRDRVRKGRRTQYVPAVLRYNEVPAKVLLEVGNLANDRDRALLQTQAYRERVASAIVTGILRYYDVPTDGSRAQRVASAER